MTDSAPPWFDPAEIRELIDRVQDGYESSPAWAQTILLAMIGVGVLVVIFRIARSLVARLIGIILVATVTTLMRFNGQELVDRLSGWLT